MTWTILVLILGIALYMFGGMLLKQDTKKPAMGAIWAKKAIKVISIIMVAGSIGLSDEGLSNRNKPISSIYNFIIFKGNAQIKTAP